MMWGQQVSSTNSSNKLQDGVKIKHSENLHISKYVLQNLFKTILQNSHQYFKHLSQVDPVYNIFQQKFYNFSDIYTTFLKLSTQQNCGIFDLSTPQKLPFMQVSEQKQEFRQTQV